MKEREKRDGKERIPKSSEQDKESVLKLSMQGKRSKSDKRLQQKLRLKLTSIQTTNTATFIKKLVPRASIVQKYWHINIIMDTLRILLVITSTAC